MPRKRRPYNPAQLSLFGSAKAGRRPTSIVVGRAGPVDFRSLKEAILHAADGAVIRILQGNYEGGFEITRPTTIMADQPGKVSLSFRGKDVIRVSAGTLVLEGLDLHHYGPENNRCTPVDLAALHVVGGVALARECLITSHAVAGVRVSGKHSRVLLDSTRILSCAAIGLWATDEGEAQLRECEITGSGAAGIYVGDVGGAGFVRARGCRLQKNRGAGAAGVAGRLRLDDCEILRNGRHGVEALESLRVRIAAGQISENCGSGIEVQGHRPDGAEMVPLDGPARVFATDVEVYGNGLPGVHAHLPGAEVLLDHCTVHDGKHGGLFVHSGARLRARHVEIARHDLAGAWVHGIASRARFSHSSVHDNRTQGLWFVDGAKGTVEHSDISRNGAPGVQVSGPTAKVRLRANRIAEGRDRGVLAYDHARLLLEGNELSANAQGDLVWEQQGAVRGATPPDDDRPPRVKFLSRISIPSRRLDHDRLLFEPFRARTLYRIADELEPRLTRSDPARAFPLADLGPRLIELGPLPDFARRESIVRWTYRDRVAVQNAGLEWLELPGSRDRLLIVSRWERAGVGRRVACGVQRGGRRSRAAWLRTALLDLFGRQKVATTNLLLEPPERIEIGAALSFDPGFVAELFRRGLADPPEGPDPDHLARSCRAILRKNWAQWGSYRRALLRSGSQPSLAAMLEPLGCLGGEWLRNEIDEETGLPLANTGVDHVFALWFLLATTKSEE